MILTELKERLDILLASDVITTRAADVAHEAFIHLQLPAIAPIGFTFRSFASIFVANDFYWIHFPLFRFHFCRQ